MNAHQLFGPAEEHRDDRSVGKNGRRDDAIDLVGDVNLVAEMVRNETRFCRKGRAQHKCGSCSRREHTIEMHG